MDGIKVESYWMKRTGKIDEIAYAKFIKKTEKYYRRNWEKLHIDPYECPKTEENIKQMAESYCHCYRHQFEIVVRADKAETEA